MAGQQIPIPVGPWPGGLNVRDDIEEIDSGECYDLLNMEPQVDGTMRPRRPLSSYDSSQLRSTSRLIGWYTFGQYKVTLVGHPDAAPSDLVLQYISVESNAGLAAGPVAVPGMGSTDFPTCCFLYGGKLYLVGKTKLATLTIAGNGSPTATTVVSTVLPGGGAYTFTQYLGTINNRIFLLGINTTTGLSRIFYSKATDPLTWATPDGGFFDIDTADRVQVGAVLGKTLYIFKFGSTYAFTFTSDPAVDGDLTLINPDMGATTVTEYQNSLYLVNNQGVYLFQNNSFHQLSSKVNNLIVRTGDDTGLFAHYLIAVVDRTLYVMPAGDASTPFISIYYTMNLDSGAWSRHQFPWVNTYKISPIYGFATTIQHNEILVLWAGIAAIPNTFLYIPVKQEVDIIGTVSDHVYDNAGSSIQYMFPEYRLLTKVSDTSYVSHRRFFPSPTLWKRMKWAALEGLFPTIANVHNDVIASIDPKKTGPSAITSLNQVQATPGVLDNDTLRRLIFKSFRYRKVCFEFVQSCSLSQPSNTDPYTGYDSWNHLPFYLQGFTMFIRPGAEVSV